MDAFVIEIAGASFEIQPLFETTALYCRDYLVAREPEYRIFVRREELAEEQRLLDLEADEEGLKRRKFAEPFLERSLIQRKVAEYLLERDVLLMHGSTVAVDGQAYLFTAPCGTGKSTHTRLWREVFGDRAVMVNDDKPFLQLRPDGFFACGSPWSGKHGLDSNVTLPLHGICILERGSENRIRPMTAEEALPMLLHQSYQSPDPAKTDRIDALVRHLASNIPLWHMECTKEQSAAIIAHEAMSI